MATSPIVRRTYGASRSRIHCFPEQAEVDPVVEPVPAALPELEDVGDQPVTAPIRRPRDGVVVREALPDQPPEPFQLGSARHHLALR